MGKITGSYFENPYLEDGEHNPSVELVMDEARQRWRAGGWKPKEGSFELERGDLAEESDESAAPSSDRFKLDIKKDLMGEGISLESLSELSYTPSYRPKGVLEKLDEATFVPMSTLQRYDVLAGDLESPPDDISFLSDAQTKHRKAVAKSGEKKDGKLRTDTKRLEESVDSRRSEILRLLPSADGDDTKRIIDESKRRKAREDRELGRPSQTSPESEKYRNLARLAKDAKKRKREYLSGLDIDPWNDYDRLIKTEGERMTRLPKQDGMTGEKRDLPQFESESRYWSRINSVDPTWSEIAENSEASSPDDEEISHEPRYVDEKLFDEKDPYKELLPPRKRLRSDEAGHFDTEYIREAGIDPKHIKEIMEKKYRGRWVPPEFFSEDQLVNEWFNQYNRGTHSGEDYMHWAYNRKMAERQREQAEKLAAQQAEEALREAGRKPAYHANSDGRKYPPFAQAVPYMPSAIDESDRIEQAQREGYMLGAELDRRDRIRREREEERRRELERRERERGDDMRGRGGRYNDRNAGRYPDRRGGYAAPRPYGGAPDRYGKGDIRGLRGISGGNMGYMRGDMHGMAPRYDGRRDAREYQRYPRPYDPRERRDGGPAGGQAGRYDSRYNMRGNRDNGDRDNGLRYDDRRERPGQDYPRRKKYW